MVALYILYIGVSFILTIGIIVINLKILNEIRSPIIQIALIETFKFY